MTLLPAAAYLNIHTVLASSCFLISNTPHCAWFPHLLLHLAPPPLLAVPLPHLLPLLQHLPRLLHPPPPHHSPPSWPFLHPHFLSKNRNVNTVIRTEGRTLYDSFAAAVAAFNGSNIESTPLSYTLQLITTLVKTSYSTESNYRTI